MAIPEGMRDVVPPESGDRRALEDALLGRFAAYGYGQVMTPWLEFAGTFEAAGDETLADGYRLYDRQGHELVTRTDMTVPVARLAATRFDDGPLPLRFCYVAPSIRPWAPQRSQDGEFAQAGAELLGLGSAGADAESVTLLCDCLTSVGLSGFRIALGSVAFYVALVDSLGLDDDDRETFVTALADRDYPLMESVAGNAGVDERALGVLWKVLELSGSRDGLGQARKLATTEAMDAAIRRMVEVRDLVDEAGFADAVAFDFGMYPDLSYYSGVIYEAFAPGVGLPIATGGRYDGLLERFEWDIPGVGFAIAVDRLLDAMAEAGVAPAGAAPVLAFSGGLEEPARAAELRRAGWAVAALPEAAPAAPPWLRREGGRYVYEAPDGTSAAGGWRDVRRALGLE
jgi:ATP phosphoribosyltransferase regulatory subunit